jgi:hypothetical protein
MRLYPKFLLLPLLVIALLAPGGPARADVGPPSNPPGGDVSPEGATDVEMLAEEVLIDFTRSSDDHAQVTAWFRLRNTGSADEHLRVRFPLSGNPRFDTQSLQPVFDLIGDMTVSVGDVRVPTEKVLDEDPNSAEFFLGVSESVMYWAAFDVDFPAGVDVEMTVKYTFDPTGEQGLPGVRYVIATGAGWKGPIGAADLIIRFPYLVSDDNVPYLSRMLQTEPNTSVVGNDLRWHWEGLEPTYEDNLDLGIVPSHLWQEVLRRQAGVNASPNDAGAWLALARAFYDADVGIHADPALDDRYVGAFRRALDLAPARADLRVEIASILYRSGLRFDDDYTIGAAANELAVALELDPQNADALALLADMQRDRPGFVLPTPGPFLHRPTPTPTRAPSATPTPAPTSTSTATAIAAASLPTEPPPASPLATGGAAVLPLAILLSLGAGFGAGWLVRSRRRGG